MGTTWRGPSPGTAAESPTDERDPSPDEEAPAPDTAGTAHAPSGEALATTTLPIDWVDGGELEMAVTGIEVAGELLRVAVTFTASLPPEAEDVALGAVLLGNENRPVTTEGRNFSEPVAPEQVGGEDNPEGRARNRRVEATFAEG